METIETMENILTKIGFGKFNFFLVITMGMIQSCDAIEMLILAFIGPILNCEWKITVVEMSILTTGVFIGIMIGSAALGRFSDKFGRKPTLVLTNVSLLYIGLLSSASPTISWMIITRLMIGVFIGGNSSSIYTLLSELTPIKHRGTSMVSLQLFWSLGSFFITILSYLITPVFGWRVFLVSATFPIIFVLIALIWIPESPRFLLLQNQKKKCLEILNDIAKMNKSIPISDIYNPTVQKTSFRDLIHSNYLRTMILTSYIWFVSGLMYYSVVIILTIINGISHRCLQNMRTLSQPQANANNQTVDDSCCFQITWNTYRNILISTTGEIFFIPISLFLINFVGRKKTISIYLATLSIGVFLLNLCMSSFGLAILFFVIRGVVKSLFNVTIIYTTEVLPTSVRSLGVGVCNMFARSGAMLSPFIVNILIAKYSFLVGTMILFLLSSLGLIASVLLPYETQDRQLFQTADHDSK